MFQSTFSFLSVIFLCKICLIVSVQSDTVGYPEDEEKDPYRHNADGRKPVYIPNRCAEGEILYPGDQKGDWVCDCKPGYLFYPKLGKCFEAYSQGPCNSNELFTLLPGELDKKTASCHENNCSTGMVSFNNTCVEINVPNTFVCGEYRDFAGMVTVNQITLELECVPRTTNDAYIMSLVDSAKKKQNPTVSSTYEPNDNNQNRQRPSNTRVRFGGGNDESFELDVINVVKMCVPGSRASLKQKCKP